MDEQVSRMDEQVLARLRSSDRFVVSEFGQERRLQTVRALERAVQHGNTSLKYFVIRQNCLEEISVSGEEVALLTRALRKCSGLVDLNMGWVNLTDEQARMLAKILPALTNLEKLGLARNTFGDEGMVALVRGMVNSGLKKLHLGYNIFGARGAQALAESLHGNTSLILLTLRSSNIEIDGVSALARALRVNNTLRETRHFFPR